MLTIRIPGEPVAQGRPRSAVVRGHARVFDPPKSRRWKADAQAHMRAALEDADRLVFPDGPVSVRVRAVFTCPRGDYRKREPRRRRPHAKRPDAENVAKAVLDAGTGILWRDDAQVARLVVEKIIAAQGEAPFVEVVVGAREL